MDSTKASCWVNNKLRAHEEQWKEDDCTFCQCVDGEPHCTAMACKQSCHNPVKIPGECCPFCEGTETRRDKGEEEEEEFYSSKSARTCPLNRAVRYPTYHMKEAPAAPPLCHRGRVDMSSLKGRPRRILQAAGFFVFLYYPLPAEMRPTCVCARLPRALNAGGRIIEVDPFFFL